jgi:general secretion pathway protein L
MVVIIAATARGLIAPFANAISSLGVDALTVFAPPQDETAEIAAIKVFEQRIRDKVEAPRVRRALVGLLAGAGALAGASLAVGVIFGDNLQAQREDLTRRIAARRAAIQPGQDWSSAAARALERRKRETPSPVIVIEALSRILPDDTYLSELRILGDKMQIVGLTRDAPSLIRLIEQTSHFTSATFYAPTTRSPSESGEHFYIEVHIEPVYKPSL